MELQFQAAETTETIHRVRHDVISGTVSLTDLITGIIDYECKKVIKSGGSILFGS